MTWSPKKTDKLEVRLPTHTKQAFLARCRIEGRSASETVRGFVEEHLARPLSPQELKMIARSPYTYAGLAAAAAVGVFVAVSAQPTKAQPDFTAIFKSMDRDGDGRLSAAEFGGTTAPSAAPAAGEGRITIGGPFSDYDTNQDASISNAEYLAVNQGAVLKRFLALDANSDGSLTVAELQRQGALLGDAASGMAINGPAARMVAKLDRNGDGALSETEFGARP